MPSGILCQETETPTVSASTVGFLCPYVHVFVALCELIGCPL